MRRWKRHVYDAQRRNLPYPFSAAIRLYGVEAFKHQVLAVLPTLEEAFQREREEITRCKARTSDHGYNVQPGGTGCPPSAATNRRKAEGCLKRWAVVENRSQHSETMRRVLQRPDTNMKLREKMAEVANRPEERQRRAQIARRKFSKRIAECDPITGETLIVYASIRAAAMATGVRCGLISAYARHLRQTPVGASHWRFVD